MQYEQLMIPYERHLPCSNPYLVEGYISLEEIFATDSGDFGHGNPFDNCPEVWCEHALNYKREDHNYRVLVEHFRKGGKINVPVLRMTDHLTGEEFQSNGHHRIIAALDAGFTHIPYQLDDDYYGWCDDWYGTSGDPDHEDW